MMNENLMVEYVYAIKDYIKETIIGAFYDLSDAEEMVLSLTEEIAYSNSFDIYYHSLHHNMEKACRDAWHIESLVWSYGIEAIPIFNY